MKPKLLDLFSCAGGAARGYADAGFDVYGVDIDPQPRYPYPFCEGDVLDVMCALIGGGQAAFTAPDGATEWLGMDDFDVIHASPPCQRYSSTRSLHSSEHPDLVGPTRELLVASGKPYVIENVVGAPLLDPIRLAGTDFNMTAEDVDGVRLKLVRVRLFESNIQLTPPPKLPVDHSIQTASVYGAGGGWTPKHRDNPERRGGYIPHIDVIKRLLGIDWMTKHELSQSIPPVFTEHVGRQLITHLAANELEAVA